MRTNHRRVVQGTGLAALIALAACSSSSTKSTSSTAPTTVAGATATTTAGPSLPRPIKIAEMWEVKGESSFAIDALDRGAKLAVDEINAAGGVGGRPVEVFRIPASSDVQKLTSEFIQAQGNNPDVMIGLAPPQLSALTRQIDTAGIPILAVGSYTRTGGFPAGSKWLFQMFPDDANGTGAAAKYAVDGLSAKKVALLHTNESFGTNGAASLTKLLKADNVTITTDQAFAPTATDLTGPVLATKGADATINWGYPGPLAVQVKQFGQNGITMPTISGPSAATIVNGGLVDSTALPRLFGVASCNPLDPSRTRTKTFADNFRAKYQDAPEQFAGATYDAVYLAVAAIEQAGSLDHTAVRNALTSIKYTNGVCSSDYHADGAQVMSHQELIVGFTPAEVTKATYTFPDLAAGS